MTMVPEPRLHRVGKSATPVLQVDGIGAAPDRVRGLAAALGPLLPARNNYPGLRRIVSEVDGEAFAYFVDLLNAASPFIAGAFDLDGFDLIEASFSLVTLPPERLSSVQRAPHFDSVDPDLFAVLHYLTPTEGTAFYRHRESGIELLDDRCVDDYVRAVKSLPAASGYVFGSNRDFEMTGSVDGRSGRLVAYPGRLLHSGRIPPDFVGSSDPLVGRLTANMFIRGRREQRDGWKREGKQ